MQLNLKLKQMSERIRNLEDALEIIHGVRSQFTHPLLKEDLKAIKSDIDCHNPEAVRARSTQLYLDPGTLLVSLSGPSRFHGRGTTEVRVLKLSDFWHF